MRKLSIILLLVMGFIIPVTRAQEPTCEAIDLAREIDALYNTFVSARGEVDAVQALQAAEDFHAAMGLVIIDCGGAAFSGTQSTTEGLDGDGTAESPYAFGQPGPTATGLTVRPLDFIQDAGETLQEETPEGFEWVLVTVEVGCPRDSRAECQASVLNFRLLGSSGTLYDAAFAGAYEDALDAHLPAGRVRSGGIPFLVSADEASFNLVFYPETFASTNEQELTYFRTGNFVRISSDTVLNVRGGPGVQFPPRSAIQPGQDLVAIGRNADGTWIKVEQGWISADAVITEVGNIMWLPLIEEGE